MATLSYATSSSGPSAGGIGWINFQSGFSLAPGSTQTGLSVTLLDGSVMTFDVTNTAVAGGGFTYTSTTAPTVADAAFGNLAYTGISGQVALLSNTASVQATSTISLSNISVVDPNGNPVSNYMLVAVDAEVTNAITESIQFTSNGGYWSNFYTIGGSRTGPSITGLGTQNVTFTGVGVAAGPSSSPVLISLSPTTVSVAVATNQQQAIAFGVALNKVEVKKSITSRYSTSDQFTLAISGTPSNTATTTGSTNGLQPISAAVYGLPGNNYTINESMAAGSFGALSNYTTTVVWTNLAAGGTVGPSPGALGNTVTAALGDVLIATITNTVNQNAPGRGVEFI